MTAAIIDQDLNDAGWPPGVTRTSLPLRIWSKINWRAAEGGCWLWSGATLRNGYGHASFDGRMQYIHRLMVEDQIELIPEGMVVDHSCGVRACCRPDHLRITTRRGNGQHRTVASKRPTGVFLPRNVYLHARTGRYEVRVGWDGRRIFVGGYGTPEAAARAAHEARLALGYLGEV